MKNCTRDEHFTQPEIPSPCPRCGHRPVPYDDWLSALLDTTAMSRAVVQGLKAQAGEVAS